MSIIKMRKMTLIGLGREKGICVDALSKLGCVHVDEIDKIENTVKILDEQNREALTSKMSDAEDCLSFINFCQQKRETLYAIKVKQEKIKKKDDSFKAKNPFKGFRIELGFDEFEQKNKQEVELVSKVIDGSKADSARLFEIESEKTKLLSVMHGLKPYMSIDKKFSEIVNTENVFFMLGVVEPTEKKLQEFLDNVTEAETTVVGEGRNEVAILSVFLKSDKEKVLPKLAELNFVKCPFDFDMTAKEKYDECREGIKAFNTIRDEILDRTCALFEHVQDLKVLYDFYNISLQKNYVDNEISKTKSTFLMQGWIPVDKQEDTSAKLDEVLTAKMLTFDEPLDSEEPPTLTKNNRFVSQYECITNMYSVPNYRERDPNRFVAVFYFLFFGVMMGDAGYGLLMTVFALLFAKFLKPEGGTRKLVFVIALGGVSTFLWGILFGGWFGADTAGTIFRPLLFNPIEQPLNMIFLSLGLGVFQICTGIILNAVAKIEKKKVWDAIFDDLIWVMFFMFIVILALAMAFNSSLLQSIGLYGMFGSLVVVLLSAGRHKKGVGKVIGGLGGLYKIIGFLSDILSYLRLFGLGLATGVIGMVFNEIAAIFTGPVGMILAVVVLLIGHSLNIAINVLGAYIHDSRLQFIEFFSRFYTGEGYLFTPLAGQTKYIKIKI